MRCIVCTSNNVELIRSKTAESGCASGHRQCWMRYLCHHCSFEFMVQFNFGRDIIVRMLQDGGKIRAIRLYRMATGEGLMESKHYIDTIEQEMKHTYSTEENIS